MGTKKEQFLKIYNQIDAYLNSSLGKSINDDYEGFKKKLHILVTGRYSIAHRVSKYYDMLDEIAKVRNSVVHNNNIEPSDDILDSAKEVFEKLDNPKSIKDTAGTGKILKNVYLCSPTDNIKIVLKDMKENLYTHVPVYDGENYIGTISESSIAYWLSDHIDEDNNIIFENITVNDVVNYSKGNDGVVFIGQHYPLHELEYVFYKALENGERVGIILITNLGKIDEKPIGIVTARDLPRIKDLL